MAGAESLQHEDAPREAASTLAALLYPSGNTRAAGTSESDWVNLVTAVAAGDQIALHRLYERAHRVVFTYLVRITANRETAEELTVDVFHEVWRRAPRYDPANGTVLGWIMNQARSRAIDRLRFDARKKRNDGVDGHAEAIAVRADPHDALELRADADALRAALTTLSADERSAIESAFFRGLTHSEAATRLQQPLGTIKTRIRSGLLKLRDALGGGRT
mgnify:CR=1 FL=1